MRDVTLIFPVRRKEKLISHVCLAMKKRGFGSGRLNGMGGKLQTGESADSAAARETKEEVGIEIDTYTKVAEITFRFKHKPEWDQFAHVYVAESWNGEPVETEEMKPDWFSIESVPYDSMWPDDIHWLPHVFADKKVKAEFVFGENDEILEQIVKEVEKI